MLIEEIKKLRSGHKELFETWKAELSEEVKQKIDLYFSS